tara:strand:+ start:1029 stop:1652 length:624 start_codon:yes stop_codon:yes gene_type:complete
MLARQIVVPTPDGLVRDQDPLVLADIMREPVRVALWDRRSPVGPEVVALACRQRLAIRSWLHADTLASTLEELLPDPAYGPLREDLALLADMTTCLFGVDGVGVRVTALTKPMCPRFHVDRIPVRLLCTYGGPGSEWLPAPSVPDGLLVPGRPQEGRVDPADVQRLEPGQVAFFKGENWDDQPGKGVVHRSPPVASGGERLLVTLDV